jgi:hypothetical protein
MAAAYSRALIFPAGGKKIVPIHEDLANVRALASFALEIADANIILAHNFYLKNRKGQGSLFMYGRKFSDSEKQELDRQSGPNSHIATTGYPYPDSVFEGVPVTRVDVESGDYVVFRADYPHKVANTTEVQEEPDEFRVSWNGFLTLLNDDLVYWT